MVLLFLLGGGLVYVGFDAAGEPLAAPVPQNPFVASDLPSSDLAPIQLPDLPPNRLAIPDLRIGAEIVSTGIGSSGSMVLPAPNYVSHLDNGVAFGSGEGTNLVAGHVDDGDRTRGAMWALHRIEPGTPIFVSDSAGRVWTYRAISLQLYEKTALPDAVFDTGGEPLLVLVTCGGTTVPDPNLPSGFTYEDNVVVTARPV